jgi:hypothetical protein
MHAVLRKRPALLSETKRQLHGASFTGGKRRLTLCHNVAAVQLK